MTEQAPARRPNAALIAGAVLIVAGGIMTWVLWSPTQIQGTAVSAPATAVPTATKSCGYSPTPDRPAVKDVGRPENPTKVSVGGTVRVTLRTGQGDIPMTLERAEAPCTVQSMVFLAKNKYFDGTPCHRLTVVTGFKVLQCGDPSATGTGGPGYDFDDELPKGLKVADGERVVYPKGTVAMANAGPGTNGSQFFLVYGDTPIPPAYSVFGTFDAAGQTTIERIAEGGVTPMSEENPGDGTPKTPVTIQQAVVSG